jgi:hypothetical protein
MDDRKVEVRHTGDRPDLPDLCTLVWRRRAGGARRGGVAVLVLVLVFAGCQARRRASIRRRMSGVKISCIASSIFPPGTTMMFGRDMNESCSIDSR